jgi:tripartite-type tricarboxylate transporter receptor subunit TctC
MKPASMPLTLVASIIVWMLTGAAAFAQVEADFFRGKTITLGIPSDVGGGYDSHGRLLARYLPKYLPGNPHVIVQNNPAGAGMVLANNLYNTAPKDGTAIGIVRASVLYEQIYGNKAVKFDGQRFSWIGNMNSAQDACVFWTGTGVTKLADFYSREHVLGADAAAGMSYQFPRIYDELLGTKFKVITGYKGTPDRVLAMERGEIEGACGLTTGLVKSNLSRQYAQGKLKVIAQAGLTRDSDFPDAPNMLDQAKTPEQRQVLEFIYAQLQLSRAIAAPPGLPSDRIETLRDAFDAAIADPGLLEEAKRQKLDINPLSGEETARVVRRFFASPAMVVEKVQSLLRQN